MPYIGQIPSAKLLTASDITDGVISTAKLADSSVTSAKITDGTIASGDLASGVGGKILQVVQTTKTDTASITSSSTSTFVDLTGLSVAITPSSTSNKVLVTVSACVTQSTGTLHMNLVRNSTNLLVGDSEGSRLSSTVSSRFDNSPYTYNNNATATFTFLDSPNTTSATTYKLQGTLGATYNGTMYVNRSPGDINNDYGPRTASTITVMEVSA